MQSHVGLASSRSKSDPAAEKSVAEFFELRREGSMDATGRRVSGCMTRCGEGNAALAVRSSKAERSARCKAAVALVTDVW